MKTIVLIPCAKEKIEAEGEVEAEILYTSTYFRKVLAYAKQLNPDSIFILSDYYYLLELTDMVETYECRIPNKREWSKEVMKRLVEKGCDLDNDKFIFLTGKSYYEHMKNLAHKVCPLSGLRIGESLKWLKERINK